MKPITYLITVLVIFACRVQAQFDKDLTRRIDSLMQSATALDIFSGNIVIAHDGKIFYQKSFGYSDWEKRSLFNDSTMFNVGSNGKDFTQLVIFQLVQEGKLSFNDPLSKYLEQFSKPIADKITIRHLLTMQSGMGDYTQSPRHDPTKYKSISEIMTLIKDEPILFEPGTDRRYSNSGYVVLGGIIEKITGKTYADNIQERVLIPLGLRNTMFVYPDSKNVRNKAMGTEIWMTGEKRNESRINPTLIPTSAGGMYSSVPDMLKFYETEMYTERLLSDTMKQKMYTRYDDSQKKTLREMLSDKRFISSLAGGLNGWNSCVTQMAARHYTVIVLSNYDAGGQPAEQVSQRISRMILGKSVDALTLPLSTFVFQYATAHGMSSFTSDFDRLLKDNGYSVPGPMILNRLGYDLIGERKVDWAIEIFKTNIRLFPRNPNGYDSLGEAYWMNGNKALAMENYRKVLEMDPENQNAKDMLGKIK